MFCKKTNKIFLIGMGFIGITQAIYADAIGIQTGRYTTQVNGLKEYQIDLLQQSVSIKFNDSVQTIHQAIDALLKFSGFHLLPLNHQNKLAQVMLSNPLPNALRDIKQATLKQALSGLTGDVFNIVVDPIYRTIAFRPKASIAALYDMNNKEKLKNKVDISNHNTVSQAEANHIVKSQSFK